LLENPGFIKGSCAWRRISLQPGSFRLPQADMTRPSRKILQKYRKHRTHPKGAPKVKIALPYSEKYKVFQFEIGVQTHPRGSADHTDKHILPVEVTSWI